MFVLSDFQSSDDLGVAREVWESLGCRPEPGGRSSRDNGQRTGFEPIRVTERADSLVYLNHRTAAFSDFPVPATGNNLPGSSTATESEDCGLGTNAFLLAGLERPPSSATALLQVETASESRWIPS